MQCGQDGRFNKSVGLTAYLHEKKPVFASAHTRESRWIAVLKQGSRRQNREHPPGPAVAFVCLAHVFSPRPRAGLRTYCVLGPELGNRGTRVRQSLASKRTLLSWRKIQGTNAHNKV